MWYSEIITVTARHLSDSSCAFLQQTAVTRIGESPEPPDFTGSKAFDCCLIFQCELLRAGILQ